MRWWETNTPTLLAAARALARGGRAASRAALPVLRAAGRVLARPAVLGAAYLLVATLVTAKGPVIDATERALGRDTARIQAWIEDRFARTILAFAASLALTAIVLGAALGATAGALLRLRAWAAGRPRPGPLVLGPASLALAAALHAAILARDLTCHPQLYSDAFYDAGGWRAALQVLFTHGPGVQVAPFLLPALLLLVAPPPWRWPSLLARAVAALGRPRASALAAGACLALAAGVLVLGRPGPARRRSPGAPLNVLVIGADSFRDEALSPRVMPRLSALAEQRGVRFGGAWVSMARTLSSWTTLLTGRDPHHHGIRSMFPRWEDHDRDLDTLPGRLGRAGYRTAVVSDYGGDAFRTVDLGFQEVTAARLDAGEIIRSKGFLRAWPLLPVLGTSVGRRVFPSIRSMRELADAGMLAGEAITTLRRLRDAPFFLTVFFGASHAPYAAPAPYYRRFTDASYRGRNKYHKSRWIAPDELTTPGEAAHVHGLYEGTLASVDDAAGAILDELDRLGLTESTIIVVLGDHGENLADAPGRYYGHGNHLFGDHDLHIPLIVIDPRRPGGRVDPSVVTSADLAPTLYALTGVEPPRDMDGTSLLPVLDGVPLAPRPVFAETELWIGAQPDLPDELRLPYPELLGYSEIDADHGDALVLKREVEQVTLAARHRMVRDGPWKLVYIPTAKGVVYRLFDVVRDPENLTDVSAAHPEVKARLEASLWEWMLRDPRMEKRHGYLLPRGVILPAIDGARP